MSIRDAILACQDLEKEPIELPAWQAALGGTQLYVRAMTAWEADRLGEAAENKQRNYAARIAVLTLVDAEGNRVFQDGDAKLLKDKDAASVAKISNTAMRLSGMGEPEPKKSDGSPETTTDDSPSDSQFLSGE